MSVLAGLAVGAGVANAVGNIGGTILNQYNADKTRQFNREEAEKNRAFQREMAQNNIKYAVQQANELGISPSLILGDQTNALGGSQASVGNPPPNNNMAGIGNLANVLQEQYRLKTLEEMNEDKLQTMKDINNMRMGNSTTNKFEDYMKRNGYNSKEEFEKSFYNDLDNVKF